MPTHEQATGQVVIDALESQVIGSSTTTTGAIIDTADFDMGLYFAINCKSYTDGTYTLKIEDGDDSGLSDAAVLDVTQLVYGSLPAISAALAEGDVMEKEGVHSTKRYVRASLVSTSVTTGATLTIVAVAGVEVCPSVQ